MINDAIQSMQSFGLEFADAPMFDGKIKRVKCRGSKGRNGWYVGKELSGKIYCTFGDWSTGEINKYAPDKGVSSTQNNIVWAELIRESERAEAQRHAEARIAAQKIIDKCAPADKAHPYLTKKGIKPLGALQIGGQLIIPMYQPGGILTGYQSINESGDKRYLTGTEKKGACHVIQGSMARVCICEGFATGASIHEATGLQVFVAMDAGNMVHVAREAAKRYENILVCADNDHAKEAQGKGNAGITAAKAILAELGINYVSPPGIDGTDFNDLHIERGLTSVSDVIIKGRSVEVYKAERNKEYPAEIYNPPGLLKDIVDYYNATAVKPQPLFAIAAGLALGSVVLGRRYNTGPYENFTSLYMIVAAKSGTGKDHVKQVVRTIMAAANVQWMERGEGFTAANTVVKALERQPLQISFFEEIGQRLQEAASNNRSLARGTFRKLLDIWSSCHSFSVGEEFADGTVPRAERPALTMVGLTTPKALTGAITEALIEQGFVNRILPFISNEDRSAAPLNIKKTAPPERIVKWIEDIMPKGNIVEAGMPYCADVEDEIVVPFTEESLRLLDDIEIEVIALCDKLEKCGLEDMPTRNREISMRIALIAAVMDGADVIYPKYVSWAWGLVRALYGQYIEAIKRHVGGSDYEKAKMEALTHLRKLSPEGIRPRDMPKTSPWSKWPKKLRDEILTELRDSGLADILTQRTGRKGPPSEVWVAVA